MVKGLTSPDPMQLDLMRTYSRLRDADLLQAALAGLACRSCSPSLKVAIAISLVGAIVGELPTGAQAGLGARLLAGSYYGQTVQIWAALVAAALLRRRPRRRRSRSLERIVGRAMGAQGHEPRSPVPPCLTPLAIAGCLALLLGSCTGPTSPGRRGRPSGRAVAVLWLVAAAALSGLSNLTCAKALRRAVP